MLEEKNTNKDIALPSHLLSLLLMVKKQQPSMPRAHEEASTCEARYFPARR